MAFHQQLPEAPTPERIGQAGIGKPVTVAIRCITLDDLIELVSTDYVDNQFDTLARQEDAFTHLREFFGGDCLADDIAPRIPDYKVWRRQQPDRRSLKRKDGHPYKLPPRIGYRRDRQPGTSVAAACVRLGDSPNPADGCCGAVYQVEQGAESADWIFRVGSVRQGPKTSTRLLKARHDGRVL